MFPKKRELIASRASTALRMEQTLVVLRTRAHSEPPLHTDWLSDEVSELVEELQLTEVANRHLHELRVRLIDGAERKLKEVDEQVRVLQEQVG